SHSINGSKSKSSAASFQTHVCLTARSNARLPRSIEATLQTRRVPPVDRNGDSSNVVAASSSKPNCRTRHINRFRPSPDGDSRKHSLVKARDLLPGLLRQLGIEPAWQNGIHLNIVGGPRQREALCQLNDAPLGRRVSRRKWRAQYRRHA